MRRRTCKAKTRVVEYMNPIQKPWQALAEAVHAKQAPVQHALADQRKKKNYVEFWSMIPIKDPFRLVLSEMRDRLFHTREVLHHCLMQPTVCVPRPQAALSSLLITSIPQTRVTKPEEADCV